MPACSLLTNIVLFFLHLIQVCKVSVLTSGGLHREGWPMMIKYPYITDLYRILGKCAHPERGGVRRLTHVDSWICTTNLGFFRIMFAALVFLVITHFFLHSLLFRPIRLRAPHQLHEKVRSLPTVSFTRSVDYTATNTRKRAVDDSTEFVIDLF